MDESPPAKADKDKPKTIKGKDYHWCAKHARWGRHITSVCQGKDLNKDPKTNQEPPPSPQTMACLGLSRVLSTIVLSDSEWWSCPGGTLPPGLIATIDQLQKWGWIHFATALLILVLCTAYKPPTYIPKSQHLLYKKLMGNGGKYSSPGSRRPAKTLPMEDYIYPHQKGLLEDILSPLPMPNMTISNTLSCRYLTFTVTRTSFCLQWSCLRDNLILTRYHAFLPPEPTFISTTWSSSAWSPPQTVFSWNKLSGPLLPLD